MGNDFGAVARVDSIGAVHAHSPLLRPVDRWEIRAHRVATTLLALLAPIALWAGIATWHSQTSMMEERAATTSVVQATTTADAPSFSNASSEYTIPPSLTVAARWTVDGVRHDGRVAVPAGSPAGTRADITVDEAGALTAPTPTRIDVTISAIFAGLATAVAGATVILLAMRGVRALVDRRRAALWDDALTRFFA